MTEFSITELVDKNLLEFPIMWLLRCHSFADCVILTDVARLTCLPNILGVSMTIRDNIKYP